MLFGTIAWPAAGLRGMPWLGRTVRTVGGDNSVAVVRTAILSVLALLVFGVLFATGDAIVGHWLSLVLPDVEEGVLLRIFITVAVTGTDLPGSAVWPSEFNPDPSDVKATSTAPLIARAVDVSTLTSRPK